MKSSINSLGQVLTRVEEQGRSVEARLSQLEAAQSTLTTVSSQLLRIERLLKDMADDRREAIKGVHSAGIVATNQVRAEAGAMLRGVEARVAKILPAIGRIEKYSLTSAKRVALNTGGGAALIRTEVGYVLCPSDDFALLSLLAERGDLEPGTRLFIQRYLREGDTYVDIGANIGMHVLAAARAMGGVGKVVALEPYGPTRELLTKSISNNGFSDITDIYGAAAWNQNGRARLHLATTCGCHSLFPIGQDQNSSTVEVSLLRVDDVLDFNASVVLMKIDAEGAELEVLAGASKTISRCADIGLIVEFGPSHIARAGKSHDEWMKAFAEHGLEFRVINSETGKLEEWSLEQMKHENSLNLFFSRNTDSVRDRLR
ncbi:MAG: FkbM family methyltransferase [Hyphomicrobium sp.]|uniref:FkbM family methyltransferase n=1 Tax=Hyphomicrobium sp. TaxID=82 RepID=UPI0039E66ABB